MTIDCMYYLLPITTSAMHSGAVGGKTGKTAVLPRFCKIGRGGAARRHIMVVLAGPCARAAPAAPLCNF